MDKAMMLLAAITERLLQTVLSTDRIILACQLE
jgi:hypothetical protein